MSDKGGYTRATIIQEEGAGGGAAPAIRSICVEGNYSTRRNGVPSFSPSRTSLPSQQPLSISLCRFLPPTV